MQESLHDQKMKCFANSLLKRYQLKAEDICFMLNLMVDVFSKEPNILNINVPIYIIGGIDGNFDDALSVFDIGGPLPYSTYLFLGNFSGSNGSSLNTILLLFTYKYLYRENIYFIQGINEKKLKAKKVDEESKKLIPVFSESIKLKLNEEIMHLYDLNDGKQIWSYFIKIFNVLPIAAIISQMYFCTDSNFKLPTKNSVLIDNIRRIDRTSPYEEHALVTSKVDEFLKENKYVFLITGLNHYKPTEKGISIHYEIFSSPHNVSVNQFCYIVEINENKVIKQIKMRPTTSELDRLYPLPKTSVVF